MVPAGGSIDWSWWMTNTGDYDEVVTNTAEYAFGLGSGSDEAAFRVRSAPALAITKTVSPSSEVGDGELVNYTVMLQNTGESSAQGVIMTDVLPAEVEFANWLGDNHGAQHQDGEIAWLGEIGAGVAMTWTWQVTFTGGDVDVTNTAWYRHPTGGGSGGAEATFSPATFGPLYLPLISKGYVYLPDLVVTDLRAGANAVEVTIRNVGTAPTTNNFWVDVYINPRVEPPQINQPWPLIAPQGVVWGVSRSLGVGESLTLITGGDYYSAPYSSVPPYTSPATVWAYVDSLDAGTTWGAVKRDWTKGITRGRRCRRREKPPPRPSPEIRGGR